MFCSIGLLCLPALGFGLRLNKTSIEGLCLCDDFSTREKFFCGLISTRRNTTQIYFSIQDGSCIILPLCPQWIALKSQQEREEYQFPAVVYVCITKIPLTMTPWISGVAAQPLHWWSLGTVTWGNGQRSLGVLRRKWWALARLYSSTRYTSFHYPASLPWRMMGTLTLTSYSSFLKLGRNAFELAIAVFLISAFASWAVYKITKFET